jgi:hypothetical protein
MQGAAMQGADALMGPHAIRSRGACSVWQGRACGVLLSVNGP